MPDDGRIKQLKHVAWLTNCKTTTDIELLCVDGTLQYNLLHMHNGMASFKFNESV